MVDFSENAGNQTKENAEINFILPLGLRSVDIFLHDGVVVEVIEFARKCSK